jgi:hypothetical protein
MMISGLRTVTMRQTIAITFAALLALSVVGMPAAAALENGSAAAIQESNETNTSVAPGERLSGVVSVQEAEIEGEVEERAFGIAVANAATDSQRADAVLAQINESRDRLDELREQQRELEAARENGSISEGEYRARTAALAERTETVTELSERNAEVSEGLSSDVRSEKGIDVTAIRQLGESAETMSGPETAAIARSIAGGEDGEPEEYEAPNGTAAIEHAEGSVQLARERLNATEQLVDETNASANATEALAEAREQLDNAEAALEAAKNASAAGDDDRARELAEEAADGANEAVDAAADASESARDRADDRRDGDRGDGEGTDAETPEEGENTDTSTDDSDENPSDGSPSDGDTSTATPDDSDTDGR